MFMLLAFTFARRRANRAASGSSTVSSRRLVRQNAKADLPKLEPESYGETMAIVKSEGVASARYAPEPPEDVSRVATEDDELLQRIQQAALSGDIDPTQDLICKLLRSSQPKASRLNRQYHERRSGVHGRSAR